MKSHFALISVLLLSGCASTSVTPISQNQFLLSTSAAPACGKSGSAKVAAKMASVETLRRGYPRFVILGAGSENNVSLVSTGPTYANTYANASIYGNTAYGQSTTYYGGNQVMALGTHDSDLHVLMLKPGDAGYENAIDARTELGPDWAAVIQEDVLTCT